MKGSKNQIIKDSRVLEADYLPNKLVHREGERQEIARNLEPILNQESPVDMLLHGPLGTGKTAMARYVLKQLEERESVQTRYVDCFRHKNKFSVFYELLGENLSLPRGGTSTEEVIEKFEEKTRKEPVVAIIDEVGQIADEEVLYELSRFQNMGLIYTANDPNIFGRFNDKIQSRLTGTDRIEFKPYTNDQMKDILRQRRKYGLRKEVLTDKMLRKVAVASEGDARAGVKTLNLASNKAENQGMEEITQEVVDKAITDSGKERRIKSRNQFNNHQKAVEDVLYDGETPMKMGDLYEDYRTQVQNFIDKNEEPLSKRQLRRHIDKMQHYDVIESDGEKRWKEYYLGENSFYRT